MEPAAVEGRFQMKVSSAFKCNQSLLSDAALRFFVGCVLESDLPSPLSTREQASLRTGEIMRATPES